MPRQFGGPAPEPEPEKPAEVTVPPQEVDGGAISRAAVAALEAKPPKEPKLPGNLPFYEIGQLEVPTPMKSYTCTRGDCLSTFYVADADPLHNKTAPCPHCQKVSKVPESDVGPDPVAA